MWLRDFRSPPKALALFQVYHRFAPLTDFRGLTWRIQVDQDVCLQAYLVAGPSQGSFIHVRRGPTLAIQPPLMRIEGQVEGLFPNELPLESWIAQGTRWWLRNLGSVLVDKPLRLTLLNGLLEMDRTTYPDVESAIAYHPIVPLVDGSWISLDQLRTYPKAYQGVVGFERAEKGWHQGLPVVEETTAKSLCSALGFPFEPLAPENQPPQSPHAAWKYTLKLTGGDTELTLLENPSGYSDWWLGSSRDRVLRVQPLFRENPLSFSISTLYRGPISAEVPSLLHQTVCLAIRREATEILASLPLASETLHEICGMVALLMSQDRQPAKELWALRYDGQRTLRDVSLGRADLARFPKSHPIHLLAPRPPAAPKVNQISLHQLHWSQKFEGQRLQLRFRSNRDGHSRLITQSGPEMWHEDFRLWPDWPLGLDVHLFLEKPWHSKPADWQERLRRRFLRNLETPLQLLQTYPEALHEVCCLVGIALQAKQNLPRWVWRFRDIQNRTLEHLLENEGSDLDPAHPLSRLREIAKR